MEGGSGVSSLPSNVVPVFLRCLQVLYPVISPAGGCSSPGAVIRAGSSAHFTAG